jgi:SAM-dependent methyltransferase
MDIAGWDERYRSREAHETEPEPLVVETAMRLPAGAALDLACGAGRNALWLAERGWRVTAIDGAPAAIEILRQRASERSLRVDARVADLEKHEYQIAPSAWDLIVICRYLQRDLLEPAKLGLVPGGVLLQIALVGEQATYKRLVPGELDGYFQGWEILHRREDGSVSEIVARRPR